MHRVEGRIQKIERWSVPKCHKRWKLLCLRSIKSLIICLYIFGGEMRWATSGTKGT